jgi:hypothetical protein
MRSSVLRRILLLSLLAGLAAAPAALAAAPAPNVATGDVADVGQTLVTLKGTVDPNGAAATYVFQYGTSALNQTTETRNAGSGDGSVSVSVQVGALRAGTKYQYRIVATNEGGSSSGATRTFTTAKAPATPPYAATGSASAIDQDGATLSATLNNRGADATYHFEYGPTTGYGASTANAPLGPDRNTHTVTAPIGGLTANTTYHYRVVLVVGTTTVRGTDRSFKTAKVPNGLLIQSGSNPVRYGAATQISGILAGSDNSGKTVTVQADTFPYGDGYSSVASGRTDGTGAYRITVSPVLTSTRYRTVADTNPDVMSQPLAVGVSVLTSIHVSTQHPRRGARVRFRGSVQPGQPGASVSIQRRVGHHWQTVARTRQTANGYSRRVRVRSSGRYRVVARASSGAHVMGASGSRTLRVRR